MSWLKNKLQTWLEVKVQHQCEHTWEVLETKKVEELFQMSPVRHGSFYLPNLDTKTYKTTRTKYIMKCSKCGDLQSKVL
jgi:hypothetical protein